MKLAAIAVFMLADTAIAQAPSMKQLMLDLIHPALNDVLLFVNRDDKDWATVRRGALSLAEAGNLLMLPGNARDQGQWMKDASLIADAGTAAYKAAQAKDINALAALTESIDHACTTCHKHYRPNVFPREGDSK